MSHSVEGGSFAAFPPKSLCDGLAADEELWANNLAIEIKTRVHKEGVDKLIVSVASYEVNCLALCVAQDAATSDRGVAGYQLQLHVEKLVRNVHVSTTLAEADGCRLGILIERVISQDVATGWGFDPSDAYFRL
jgi:hypothetical protein